MSTHHLIVQAHEIASPDLKALHRLVAAQGIEKIDGPWTHQAFRLCDADPQQKDAVAQFCAPLEVDWAFVPAGAKLSDFGLLAMDMDSSLITIECIDEIADHVGRKAEVAAITVAAMRGEVDWPTSLRQRVAVLRGLSATALDEVYRDRLQLSPGATHLLAAARRCGLRTLLVSGGFTYFTSRLQAELGLDEAYANTLEIRDGVLTGTVVGPLCDADAKARYVCASTTALGIEPADVMVIGDGANDLPMMRVAGTSIAYHAKPVVAAQARYALQHLGLDAVLALFPTPL